MHPTKVVLLACGSYNPPTNMHLRMFEIARDHLHRLGSYVVIGGLISPTHDSYGKSGLESSTHRLAMIKLALSTSNWIKVTDWECQQNCWSPTRSVLQYHQNTINSILNSNNSNSVNENDVKWLPDNIKSGILDPVQVKLLCGGDLLESFGVPGLWKDEDIAAIVGQHGLVVITRENSNPLKFIYESDLLTKYMSNIVIVNEWIKNEISSTRIRRALRRSESVKYLVPDNVINYIHNNALYGSHQHKYIDHPPLQFSSVFLTPSPSDVLMESSNTSPVNNRCAAICGPGLFNSQTVNSNNKRLTVDSLDSSNSPKRPGQAVKIVTEESGKHKTIKSKGEVCDKRKNSSKHELKSSKSCTDFESICKSKEISNLRNSESQADFKTSKSCDENLIKFIFTNHGIQVISDFETIV